MSQYSPSGERVPTLAFRLRHPKQAVLAFESLFETWGTWLGRCVFDLGAQLVVGVCGAILS